VRSIVNQLRDARRRLRREQLDNLQRCGKIVDMTPTITQMQAADPPLSFYKVVVRTFKRGLAGVPIFEDNSVSFTPYRERVVEVTKQPLTEPGTQVRVEFEDAIVAIGVHGALLWLDRVPPPKYWLDYRRRKAAPPSDGRMAACGLPIPLRYRQPTGPGLDKP
jgi:hypothetical protein